MKSIRSTVVLFALLSSASLLAQEPYKRPPQDVVDIVDAPPIPSASLSPGGRFLLLTEHESMPDIAYMSQPLLRLAGMRITPGYNSRQRTSFNTGFLIKGLADNAEVRVKVPPRSKLGYATWSTDEK